MYGGCRQGKRARRHPQPTRVAPRTSRASVACTGASAEPGLGTHASPVGVVGGDLLGLRQAEDALLEAEFGVGCAHEEASGWAQRRMAGAGGQGGEAVR